MTEQIPKAASTKRKMTLNHMKLKRQKPALTSDEARDCGEVQLLLEHIRRLKQQVQHLSVPSDDKIKHLRQLTNKWTKALRQIANELLPYWREWKRISLENKANFEEFEDDTNKRWRSESRDDNVGIEGEDEDGGIEEVARTTSDMSIMLCSFGVNTGDIGWKSEDESWDSEVSDESD